VVGQKSGLLVVLFEQTLHCREISMVDFDKNGLQQKILQIQSSQDIYFQAIHIKTEEIKIR